MINFDGNFQSIVWSHDELPYEPFVHKGLLNSFTLNPRITVGLFERLNITISQVIGIRKMRWDSSQPSIHHRTEDTTTDFINNSGLQARGGFFGDSRFQFKYLYKDVGMKEGSRIFFGAGLVIPSKAILLQDPFNSPEDINDIDEWNTGDYDHRHFSLSNGVYQSSFEFQIFNKRFSNPIFYGFAFNIDIPIEANKYGYLPGINYNLSSSMIFERKSYQENKFNVLPMAFLYGLSIIGFEEASWEGSPTPNSKTKMLVPSIGGVWPTQKGSFSLSIQKPFFVEGKLVMVGADDSSFEDPLNNKTDAFEVVLGYRRNLGYIIPWL